MPTLATFLDHHSCPAFLQVCFGQQVLLVGSAEGMGGWQLESGLALTWSEGHCWSATVPLPLGADVEFKFVITDPRQCASLPLLPFPCVLCCTV